MLNAPAPFPQVGSYAVYVENGSTVLVRIQHRMDRFGEPHATISLPRTWRASGNKLVPLADLIDGTPLTAAESAERLALYARNGAAKRPRPADVERYDALRSRALAADTLADLLRRAGLDRIAA
jgi:hypothetical protein